MSDIFSRIEHEIPRLLRYALALTRERSHAEDLVQDALTRALEKSHLWEEGTDLRAWLFTIMHNQYVNSVRRSVRQGTSVNIDQPELRLSCHAEQEGRLRLRDLHRALAKLPEEQRDVILLVGMEGLNYEAAAEITNVPVGTVRSRLSRGRAMLRVLMDEDVDPSIGPSVHADALRRRAKLVSARSPAA